MSIPLTTLKLTAPLNVHHSNTNNDYSGNSKAAKLALIAHQLK
jgi:hypothetical protein